MAADHPRRIGPYEVVGVLGKGAMGQVYKAVQPSLNRLVAIKVLPPEFLEDESRVERFEREARAVALLNHPNVVQIIDKDREDDLLYFVMEYVPGSSLDVVMRQRRLSLHEVFTVARGICSGLEAAHRQNIVHRDLNPRNVLISDDLSVVKLADFGISRVDAISRELGTLSTSEVSLGTLHYMSPEQAADMAEVDHRSDIYSLGVTLYEMLTGRVPVGRFSLPSQVNSEVPSDVDPLVLRCLEADPANRYRSVSEVLADLRRIEDRLKLGLVHELKGISRSTQKIFRRSTRTVFHGRRRAMWIGAVGLAAAAAVVAGLLLVRRPPGPAAVPADPARQAATPAGAAPPAAGPGPFEVAPRPGEAEPEPTALAGRLDDLEAPPDDDAPGAEARGAESRLAEAPAAVREPAPVAEAASRQAQDDLKVARDKIVAQLYTPALQDLQRFLDEHADSPLLPEAYWLVAQAHLGEGRIEQAMATYVEIGSRFAESKEAPAAALEHARLTQQTGELQAARRLFAAVAADYPDTRWAAPALAGQAEVENELKLEGTDPVLGVEVPLATFAYRTLVERYPDAPEAEWAFWALGEAYEEAKQFELAAQSYAELGRRFPGTRLDAWWKAGRIYDRKLDQNELAIEAYLQVPESSRHHDDARRRAARLSS